MRTITLGTLKQELSDLQATAHAFRFLRHPLIEHGASPIADLSNCASLQPMLERAHRVNGAESLSLSLDFTGRMHHRSAIMTATELWIWVDFELPKLVKDRMADSSSSAHPGSNGWLSQLTEYVQRILVERRPTFHAHRRNCPFLAQLDHPLEAKVHNRQSRVHYSVPSKSFTEATVKYVTEVLLALLGLKPEVAVYQRAWFCRVVMDEMGPTALTMEWVWAFYRNFKVRDLLAPSRWSRSRDAKIEDLDDFRLELKRIMAEPSAVAVMGQMESILTGRYTGLSAADVAMSHLEEWGRLSTFVIVAKSVALQRPISGNKAALRLEEKLLSDPNRYQPFRESTPDRVRSRAPDGGPYHPSTITTPAGLFSCIVWRAITYGSQFSREHSMMFSDWAHFQQTVEKADKPHDYFINPHAYGNPTGQARIQNAAEYWKSVLKLNWESASQQTMSFKECSQLLSTSHLPGVGDLIRYLIVTDIAYAGVCDLPLESDVSSAMLKGKRGSYKVLSKLGIPTSGVSLTDQALRKWIGVVHNFVGDRLTSSEQARLVLDRVCVEHLLCKFGRVFEDLENAVIYDNFLEQSDQ